MINKENILAVANAIENGTVENLGFNMAAYLHEDHSLTDRSDRNCGTTACICGWAMHVSRGKSEAMNLNDYRKERAAMGYGHNSKRFGEEFFGIDSDTGNKLFLDSIPCATSKLAIRVLRNLAKTGKVDWNLAQHELEIANATA